MSELVNIKHREYGTVEGVTQRPYTSGWEKFEKGRLSFFDPEQGWSLAIEPEWITIEVDKELFTFIIRSTTVHNIYGAYGQGEIGCPWRYPKSPKKGQAT